MHASTSILLIGRAPWFSPNSVDRDEAILLAVRDELRGRGYNKVETLCETELPVDSQASIILSMGRAESTLTWLSEKEGKGVCVLNSGRALLRINRRALLRAAQQVGADIPPFCIGPLREKPFDYPFWWKRDDRASQEKDDVLLIDNDKEWHRVADRDVGAYVVEKHLQGDIVKFYGVAGTRFMHWNYPEFSKFGKEKANGKTQGLHFDERKLKQHADALAQAVGVHIYGGDAIVTEEGRACIIDFNDWPSFSSCRKEAAEAIALKIEELKN